MWLNQQQKIRNHFFVRQIKCFLFLSSVVLPWKIDLDMHTLSKSHFHSLAVAACDWLLLPHVCLCPWVWLLQWTDTPACHHFIKSWPINPSSLLCHFFHMVTMLSSSFFNISVFLVLRHFLVPLRQCLSPLVSYRVSSSLVCQQHSLRCAKLVCVCLFGYSNLLPESGGVVQHAQFVLQRLLENVLPL